MGIQQISSEILDINSSDLSQLKSILQRSDDINGGLEDDTCIFSINSNLQTNEIKSKLESYWRSTCFNQNYPTTKPQFIWHCGHPPSLNSINGSRLDGRLNYSISLQDEWFLVWCLIEISKEFDCQIQIYDNDGEFLLIEVADYLPRWITPDLAKGRVWIKSGSIHLIPPELTPSIQGPLSSEVALEILRSTSHSTLASESINSHIMNRVQLASPEALSTNHLFNAEAYLHNDISKALSVDPNMIGLAVKAFCEKDADSFKVCREMPRFPPQTPSKLGSESHNPETVSQTSLPCLVRMTRPLYAILLNHESTFHPPKPFEKVGWMNVPEEETSEWKRRLVGMKISCGFEMMLSSADKFNQKKDGKTFQKPPRGYKIFLDKLQNCGYFQNELNGSAKWVELEAIALKAYLTNLKPTDLINRFESAITKSDPTNLNIISQDFKGESDEWLSLNEEQIKSLFKQGDPQSDVTDKSYLKKDDTQFDPDMKKISDFTCRVDKFIDAQGSLEGALHSDDEVTSGSDDTSSEEDSEQEALRANIFPSQGKTKNKSSKSSTKNVSTKDKAKMGQRLASIVPGLSDGEWGRSTQRPNTSPGQKNQESLIDTQLIATPKKVITPTKTKSLRRLAEQSYDGVCEESSGNDSDSDDLETMEGHLDAEMMDDIDMEAERDDFLKFAQEALGLTSEQYEAILDDRRGRGAYVPPPKSMVTKSNTILGRNDSDDPMSSTSRDPSDVLSSSLSKGKQRETLKDHSSTGVEHSKSTNPIDDTKDQKVLNVDLDTFDKLMNRMDQELKKRSKSGGPISTTGLGPDLGGPMSTGPDSDVSSDSEADMGEINEAMQSELADLMKESGVDLDEDSENNNQSSNYSLISNFLESYKSQVGLPGPVGNMAGRIGLNLDPSNN